MKKLPFLVPPSANWAGTIAARLDQTAFKEYVDAITDGDMKFSPNKIVLHNTAAPNQKQWLASPVYPNRMKGLTGYFRDNNKWHAGPHLFVDPEGIWLFAPLNVKGVHSPSFNSSAWGIEMVGDYDKEPFDKGFGAKVRDNAVWAMAVLLHHIHQPVTVRTILLHKEDPKTTHACPGKNVKKDDILMRVLEVYNGL